MSVPCAEAATPMPGPVHRERPLLTARDGRAMAASGARAAMLSPTPVAFMARYVARRPMQFGTLAMLIASATCCAVAAQYGMKLIVDEMALGDRQSGLIWRWFALFLGLIALESTLSRIAGWLGCRTIVQTGVDVRLDLFRHLSGHPMQFFAD